MPTDAAGTAGPPPGSAPEPGPATYQVGGKLPPPARAGTPSLAEPPAPSPERPWAVFVAHGMGQQIPFESLDLVTEGLRKQDAAQRHVAVESLPAPRVKSVVLDGERLQRAELLLRRADGSEREVHIYEGYWAPLTEGQVRLRDVIAFLFRGGTDGLAKTGRHRGLVRWLFQVYPRFPVPAWVLPVLALTILAICGLIVLNAAVPIVGLAALARALFETPPTWLEGNLLPTLWRAIAAFLALGAALALSILVSSRASSRAVKRASGAMSVFFFTLVIVSLAAAGVWLPLMLWLRVGIQFGNTVYPPPTATDMLAVATLWPILLWVSARVRRVLVQYPGDVAAYVSSHTLDRFHDLRARIKETIWEKARAVYAARRLDDGTEDGGQGADDAPFAYARCAVVGHSLGSVIAYDTLNLLILDDESVRKGELPPPRLDVVARTPLFLTLGSPLDKTAFLFGVQGRETSEAREAIAASVQPMICDYAFRPAKWVNIFSRWDIVSGPLDYYDPPGSADAKRVSNLADPQATTFLRSHLDYWRNDLLFQVLHAELTR